MVYFLLSLSLKAEKQTRELEEAQALVEQQKQQKQQQQQQQQETTTTTTTAPTAATVSSRDTANSNNSGNGEAGATAAGHGATSKADNMRRTTSILNPEDHDDSEEGNHKSESKTNSQNELMRLLAEKRETDKQHKEDEERALNNPTQRAEREAADLAEFNVSDDYCLAGTTTVCQGLLLFVKELLFVKGLLLSGILSGMYLKASNSQYTSSASLHLYICSSQQALSNEVEKELSEPVSSRQLPADSIVSNASSVYVDIRVVFT